MLAGPGRGQDVLPHRAHPALRRCPGNPAVTHLCRHLHQSRGGRDLGPAPGGAGRSRRRHDRRDDPFALRHPAAGARRTDRRASRLRHRRRELPGAAAPAARRVQVGHIAAERFQPPPPGRGGTAPEQRAAAGRLQGVARPEEPPRLRRPRAARRRAAEAPRREGAVARRWDAVLVDECQDLNPVQYEVIKAIAEGHRNLFAVGDDEQSIFSWTGAVPRVLEKLAGDFDIKSVIVLEENRRNARGIFETARRLLRDNPTLFKKALRATRESPFGVEVQAFEEDDAESAWILEDIVRDRRESGLPWGEFGVLYRTHEVGSRIEGMLLQAGVPCRLAAGRALQDDPGGAVPRRRAARHFGAGRSRPRGIVRQGRAAGDAVPADPHRGGDGPRRVPGMAPPDRAARPEGGSGDQEAPALPACARQPARAGAKARHHQRARR